MSIAKGMGLEMKRLALLLMLLLIIATGCGVTENKGQKTNYNGEQTDTSEINSEIKPDDSLEREEVPDILFDKIDLTNLPQYFEFYDYVDENTLLGLTKNKPFTYDMLEHNVNILSDNLYWNLRMSPDKNLIAFNNEGGVGILEASTGLEIMIYEEYE